MPSLKLNVTSSYEPCLSVRKMLSSHDITATGLIYDHRKDNCNVICSICVLCNRRIENVLFYCEIDYKQFYCQIKWCQLIFFSCDSLTRHIKHTHRKVT